MRKVIQFKKPKPALKELKIRKRHNEDWDAAEKKFMREMKKIKVPQGTVISNTDFTFEA